MPSRSIRRSITISKTLKNCWNLSAISGWKWFSAAVRSYYSEKYSELRIFPCLFEPDGSAVLTTENGDRLQLDKGFFEDVHVLGRTIPCIAPGGAELIRDLL